MTAVNRAKRWSEERPCPICGGHDRMPRGKGLRCSGYLSFDGDFAHCSREDYAGRLALERNGTTYAHLLEGPCSCGEQHGEREGTPVIDMHARRERQMANGNDFREVAHWDYEGGLRVVRAEAPDGRKAYWQQHRNGSGYVRGRGNAPITLYRATELRAADPAQWIFLAEGEKCADALAAVGLLSTTSPGGANQWTSAAPAAADLLRRRHVVILPDNDEPGRKYAADVRATLEKVCASLRVLELSELGEGEDVADWLGRDGEAVDLVERAQRLPSLVSHFPFAAEAALTLWGQVLPPAIPSGFPGLDRIIVGFRAESFVVLNAPPGRGKSGFTIQAARQVAESRFVLYLSSELSERQVLARAAAQKLRTPWSRLFEMGPSGARMIAEALDGLRLKVIRIRKGHDLVDLLRRAADEVGEAPFLCLDYLQHAARRLAIEDRRIAVGQLVDDIGTWAVDTRSSGLVVSSVSRGMYRPDDDATAEDFLGAGKEAGEIECDASAELYLKTELPPEGGAAPAKLHISKHRFGASGQTVGFIFDGALGLFSDDPMSALSELEVEVYQAVRDGKRSYEEIRDAVKVGKPKVNGAVRSLVRQGWIDGPPFRIVRELR